MLEQRKKVAHHKFSGRHPCSSVPENILLFNHEPPSSGHVVCSDTTLFFPDIERYNHLVEAVSVQEGSRCQVHLSIVFRSHRDVSSNIDDQKR